MSGRAKRSKVDLYATILEVIRRYPEGERITRISYGVGVPIDRLKVMVDKLCSTGLARKIAVDEDEEPGGSSAAVAYHYGVTQRGLEFLDTYWKMKGFLEVFGDGGS
ncbi:MAG: winged helix-turn-helix domain-containing protein [Thaumarchaeota archaeon]|nr:winged helix-turn-helix domain-containing protein [Nitrososphaerota archaeon]